MAQRDEFVPSDLLKHLCRAIPGFSDEPIKIQMGLSWMMWNRTLWGRKHSQYHTHFFFTYTELNKIFGRTKFTAINSRLNLFEVTHWSSTKGYTKAYKLTSDTQKIWDKYLKKSTAQQIRLLYGKGLELKTLPNAVAGKDNAGITTGEWKSANSLSLNTVYVDVPALMDLLRGLKERLGQTAAGKAQADLFSKGGTPEQIQYLIDYTTQIICLANTTVAGPGHIMHRYVEAGSGRLYAQGINLQSAPQIIKDSALIGRWEYDFSNCHYSILMQMATTYGYLCNAIKDYNANKESIRLQISQEAGINREQVKTCLLAVLYGARLSERHEDAIPEAIGIDAARRLYAVPFFAELKADIKGARGAILKGCSPNRKGGITNAMGKSLSSDNPPEKILSHLLQGVEAKALITAIDGQSGNVVLLQHDGFATNAKLDLDAVEQAINAATGYALRLEVKKIHPDLDSYFNRSNKPKRKKRKTL